MRRPALRPAPVLGLALGLALVLALAACTSPGREPRPPVSPEQRMQLLVRFAEPGPGHERLDPLVGRWQVDGRHRRAPEAEWTRFRGTGVLEWALGGRYLLQEVEGSQETALPYPYEALVILAHDRYAERYVEVSLDNYSTGVARLEGDWHEDTEQLVLEGVVSDPALGEVWMRRTYVLRSPDEWLVRQWLQDEDGDDFMAVEVTYRREES